MINYLMNVQNQVKIDDGLEPIKNILINIYFKEGISNKELARMMMLPIPIVVAIKKEFIKQKLIIQDRGIRLTNKGRHYIENELGYEALDRTLYNRLISNPFDCQNDIEEIKESLKEVFNNRPQVDVTIDQSKCTIETSIKRAILCLSRKSLIGNNILCIGDDDLVSISIGFLLKKLYKDVSSSKTKVVVLDIDTRFLDYINKIATEYNLPIECIKHDLRNTIPLKYQHTYDCVFTDPPYTLSGLNLFLSRGIEGLKTEKGKYIFLSYAHKSLSFEFDMQKSFIEMGLMVSKIHKSFNHYEGANILGNVGQMIILKTTINSIPSIKNTFNKDLYTGEIKKSLRFYQCTNCKRKIRIGVEEKIKTIEALKSQGCPNCLNHNFTLNKRV